jgi:hypothetical protein
MTTTGGQNLLGIDSIKLLTLFRNLRLTVVCICFIESLSLFVFVLSRSFHCLYLFYRGLIIVFIYFMESVSLFLFVLSLCKKRNASGDFRYFNTFKSNFFSYTFRYRLRMFIIEKLTVHISEDSNKRQLITCEQFDWVYAEEVLAARGGHERY